MTDAQRAKLFDIKCRSKSGKPVTKREHQFARKMFEKYPDEYGEDEAKVIIATWPIGSIPPTIEELKKRQ